MSKPRCSPGISCLAFAQPSSQHSEPFPHWDPLSSVPLQIPAELEALKCCCGPGWQVLLEHFAAGKSSDVGINGLLRAGTVTKTGRERRGHRAGSRHCVLGCDTPQTPSDNISPWRVSLATRAGLLVSCYSVEGAGIWPGITSLQLVPPWSCRSLSAPPSCRAKPRSPETSPVHIPSSAPAHKSCCWIQAVKYEQRKPPCSAGVGWGITLAPSLLGKKWENMALCCCCCSCCFMVSTDASNKRIMKLFPSVACPLPAVVTEKFAGFPSAEQFECGRYCCKFRKAVHLLSAKETGDFLFIIFGHWQAMMMINSNVCVLILLLLGFFLPGLWFADYV